MSVGPFRIHQVLRRRRCGSIHGYILSLTANRSGWTHISNPVDTTIFIKTCAHDAAYHTHCLRSIERFCTGFRDTVVVNTEHPKGYLDQQVVKLHADIHTDAEFILVTDSDTLFIEPVTPESFCRDGKPIWYMTPWTDEMLAHAGTRTWFNVMRGFFDEVPPAEFMRRQPFMFPAKVLPALRNYCFHKFGKTIERYIMDAGQFSEFNVLGMFCWLFFRDEFYWMDTTIECPPAKTLQFWSHDPIEKNIEQIERILQ